ncbi:hypothetical protein SNE40_003259 [Patella caerulea]|uniref:Uncharacterized protein n=1 Tax=Patella caerulea TaxID=87958 RepID=A0AAN8Q4X6_PATCE
MYILCAMHNLNNAITKPTSITETSNTLLGPIIISNGINYITADTLEVPFNIMDPIATFIHLDIYTNHHKIFQRKIYLYKRASFRPLNHDISNIDWDDVWNEDVIIDKITGKFTSKLDELIEQYIPSKILTLRSKDKRIRDRLRKQ